MANSITFPKFLLELIGSKINCFRASKGFPPTSAIKTKLFIGYILAIIGALVIGKIIAKLAILHREIRINGINIDAIFGGIYFRIVINIEFPQRIYKGRKS